MRTGAGEEEEEKEGLFDLGRVADVCCPPQMKAVLTGRQSASKMAAGYRRRSDADLYRAGPPEVLLPQRWRPKKKIRIHQTSQDLRKQHTGAATIC